MPRMRLLVAVAGEEAWAAGQVVDVDEPTAAAWCDGVRAERADEPRREPPTQKPPAEPGGEKETAVPGGERRRRPAASSPR